MNSITPALAFEGTSFNPVSRDKQVWLRLPQIEVALGYTKRGALQTVFARHADEFSASMTRVVRLATSGGQQMVRVFSLRGAHLLAMFARTEKAKAFRRWVLDILDREIGMSVPVVAEGPSKQNLLGLCTHVEFLRSWWKQYEPAIRALAPDVAYQINDHFIDGVTFARNVARSAGVKTDPRIATYPWHSDSYARSAHLTGAIA